MTTTETPAQYAAALARLAEVGVGSGVPQDCELAITAKGPKCPTGETLFVQTLPHNGRAISEELSLRILRDTLREVVFGWINASHPWGFTEGGETRKGYWCQMYPTDGDGDWFECHTLLQAAHAVAEREENK